MSSSDDNGDAGDRYFTGGSCDFFLCVCATFINNERYCDVIIMNTHASIYLSVLRSIVVYFRK